MPETTLQYAAACVATSSGETVLRTRGRHRAATDLSRSGVISRRRSRLPLRCPALHSTRALVLDVSQFLDRGASRVHGARGTVGSVLVVRWSRARGHLQKRGMPARDARTSLPALQCVYRSSRRARPRCSRTTRIRRSHMPPALAAELAGRPCMEPSSRPNQARGITR
jgi:hypothetical protein